MDKEHPAFPAINWKKVTLFGGTAVAASTALITLIRSYMHQHSAPKSPESIPQIPAPSAVEPATRAIAPSEPPVAALMLRTEKPIQTAPESREPATLREIRADVERFNKLNLHPNTKSLTQSENFPSFGLKLLIQANIFELTKTDIEKRGWTAKYPVLAAAALMRAHFFELANLSKQNVSVPPALRAQATVLLKNLVTSQEILVEIEKKSKAAHKRQISKLNKWLPGYK
jgi:hypothetical protein